VNPFITDPSVIAGGKVFGSVTIATALAPTVTDVPSSLNNIARSSTGVNAAAELLGVESGNAFAFGSAGEVVGAVFGPGDVVVPGARISILTDVNWLFNSGDIDVVDNLQLFLEGGATVVAMPEPGTALLLVTVGLFVVACWRRKRA